MTELRTAVVHRGAETPEHQGLLDSLRGPVGACVVVDCPPEVRTHTRLAQAILTGLGKRVDLTGTSRDGGEAWLRAHAWILGEAPEILVVTRAEVLAPTQWERLLELASDAGADLFLVVEGVALRRGLREVQQRCALERLNWTDLLEVLDPYLNDAVGHSDARTPFPVVPDDDFPSFLATAESVMDPRDAKRVERTYWRAFDATDSWAASQAELDEPAFEKLVKTPALASPDLNEATTRLRAAQAALFNHDLLLGFDQRALAAGYLNTARADLSLTTATAVRRLEHPQRAAAALVTLISREPPPALESLNIADLDDDGRRFTIERNPFVVPDYASGVLRALLVYRRAQQAQQSDPLFAAEKRHQPNRPLGRKTAHALQIELRLAAQEIGLGLTSRDSWAHQAPKRWLKRRGLTLRALTP